MIELLVVISITMVLSTSAMIYFFWFIWWYEIKQDLKNIKSYILELDSQINNYEIIDYEIIFDTQSWALAYISYKDKVSSNRASELIYDSVSWTWKINVVNWSWSEVWNIKNYGWWKLIENIAIDWDDEYEYIFTWWLNHIVSWSVGWESLNSIEIITYWDQVSIIWINELEDFSWTNINKLSLLNISWKKSLIWDAINYTWAYLKFEKYWVEEILEININ